MTDEEFPARVAQLLVQEAAGGGWRGVSAVGRWEVSEEVAKAAPPSSVQEFIEGRGPWASKSEAE